MSTAASAGFQKKKKVSYPYVLTVDRHSGGLYLKRERSVLFSELPYAAVLVAAVLFALVSCMQYIQIHNLVSLHVKHIEQLEQEVEILKNDNLAKEKDLSYVKNLDAVYETAVQSLGMIPATESHVVFYDQNNNEFVYQRDNIPTNRLK